MKSHKMDHQFKKIIESSENHYQEYSDEAMNFIWHEIQKKERKSRSGIWKQLAMVASILLLIAFSLGFYSTNKQSTKMIASLNLQIEQLKKQYEEQILKSVPESKIVTVEKERIVHIPVIKKEIVEKIEYIHDTIIITQSEVKYQERLVDNIEAPNIKTEADKIKQENIISTEIILSDKSVNANNIKKGFSLNQFLKKRYGQTETSESESYTIKNFLSRL